MKPSQQVFSTKEYNLFKSLDGNRGKTQIHSHHLKVLEKSILEKNMLNIRPIIVNDDMIVIDGHHRLRVAKDNNLEIFYMIYPKGTYEDAIRLTRGTCNWEMMGYIDCLARNGNEKYKIFSEFLSENKITISCALNLYSGGGLGRKYMHKFKQGELDPTEIVEKIKLYLPKIRVFLDLCKECGVKINILNSVPLWSALRKLLDNELVEENWDKLLKVIPVKHDKIIHYGASVAYVNLFKGWINGQLSTSKKIP